MNNSTLKSTTAILVSLALVAPAPLAAQSEGAPFPCIAPTGNEVADLGGLVAEMEAMTASGASAVAEATCSAEAVQGALSSLAATAAPEPVVEEAPAAEAEAVVEEQPAAEAEVVAEPEPAAEEPVAETDAEVAAEEAPAQEEPVAETPVEEPIAQEAAPEVEAEAPAEAEEAVEPQPEPEVVVEEEPEAEQPAEAEAVETAPVIEDAPVAEAPSEPESDPAPAEPAAEAETAEAEEPAAVEEAPVEEADAAPAAEAEAVADTNAAPVLEEDPTAAAGEAGGVVVTDAERQELAQQRAEEAASSAAAAATTDSAASEEEPAVTTETIDADDVRSSADDFATAVTETVTPDADSGDSNRGLSNFEKALLLGLGAAVVGSVLNNGDEVVSNSGDRVVIERDGELRVLKNDDELLQRPGAQVRTQTFQDGSTRTIVTYEDGSEITTVRGSDGTVLRRTLIRATDGTEIVLFDDTQAADPVDFASLPTLSELEAQQRAFAATGDQAVIARLERALLADVGRSFSLGQVRDFKRVRALAPEVEVSAVTFASGSAAIAPDQARALGELGLAMQALIDEDPSAVFLIEGHTDAVGAASYNLALSDRRAETVALALTEYFNVPPQNLITQGYGESDLKVPVLTDERANRRAIVRNISNLLR